MSTCAICVEDTEYPVCCVPCGHVYCRECIDEWQKSNDRVSKCPECREIIQDVMAIYIKKDDSKDEVRLLKRTLEQLQNSFTECDSAKNDLGNKLKMHVERISYHEEENLRMANSLEEQKKQANLFKEKIRHDCELALFNEKEENRSLEREKEHLIETVAKSDREIKSLKNMILEQKKMMQEQKDTMSEQKDVIKEQNYKISGQQYEIETLKDLVPWKWTILTAIRKYMMKIICWNFVDKMTLFIGMFLIYSVIYLFKHLNLQPAIVVITLLIVEYYNLFKPRRQLIFFEVSSSPVRNPHFQFWDKNTNKRSYISEWNNQLTRDPSFLNWYDTIVTFKDCVKFIQAKAWWKTLWD